MERRCWEVVEREESGEGGGELGEIVVREVREKNNLARRGFGFAFDNGETGGVSRGAGDVGTREMVDFLFPVNKSDNDLLPTEPPPDPSAVMLIFLPFPRLGGIVLPES